MWPAIANNIAIELQMKIFSNCVAKNDVSSAKVKAFKLYFDESRFVTCKRETNFEGCRCSRSEVDAELELLFFRFRSQNSSFSPTFPFILIADFTRWLSHESGEKLSRAPSRLMWGSQNTRNEKWNYAHVEQFPFTRVRFYDDDLWRRGKRAWCKNAKRATSSH